MGSTLYELVAGKPAFLKGEDDNVLAVMARLTTEAPPPLSGVPSALSDAIQTAMAKAPEERIATAADLGRRLQAVQTAEGLPPVAMPLAASKAIADARRTASVDSGQFNTVTAEAQDAPGPPAASDPGPCGQHSARGNPVPSGDTPTEAPTAAGAHDTNLGAEDPSSTPVPVPGGPPPGSSDHPPKPPRHGRLPVPALVAIAAVVLLGGAALAFALLSGGGGGEDLSPGSGPPRSGNGPKRSYRRRDEARAMRVAVPAADPTTVALEGDPDVPRARVRAGGGTSRARCS